MKMVSSGEGVCQGTLGADVGPKPQPPNDGSAEAGDRGDVLGGERGRVVFALAGRRLTATANLPRSPKLTRALEASTFGLPFPPTARALTVTVLHDPWSPTLPAVGSTHSSALGTLSLHMRREQHEVWIAGRHDAAEATDEAPWTRWAVAPGTGLLALRRALPDRPVVVSPDQTFYLPPGSRAKIFVRIPLFAQFILQRPRGAVTELGSFPGIVLSDTWWGSVTEGELAYWMPTRARRAVTPDLLQPHLAICPFVLENRSDVALPVDRFAVRVAHLTLFGQGTAAWCDEVHVRYEGLTEGSVLEYTGSIPAEAGDVDRLAEPREPPESGLRSITFGRLRALSGLT